MKTACLYCGLQFPDTAEFCPECGRPIERGFEIRPLQPSEWDRTGIEMKGGEDLQGQHGIFSKGNGSPGECPQCGAPLVKRQRAMALTVEKIEASTHVASRGP